MTCSLSHGVSRRRNGADCVAGRQEPASEESIARNPTVAPDSRRLAYGDPGEVTGRLPGETSCLTLVWAVLDLYITHATNGIKFTQPERQQLKRMRYEGHDQTTPQEVTAA